MRAFQRSRTGTLPQPIVTWALLAVTIGIGISSFLLGQEQLWRDLFALDKAAVWQDGEYWRLLTVVLVHGSIIHLAFNMYALWIIGPIVETLYGSVRFLAIYLACAAAGSAASYVFADARLSVGASGAIFGLFGVLLVADRVHKPALTRGARSLTMQIGMLIAVNLVIGFTVPAIDNAAHIGGLVAGAWLGLVIVPRGATTLASLWSRPAARPATPGATGSGRSARTPRSWSGWAAWPRSSASSPCSWPSGRCVSCSGGGPGAYAGSPLGSPSGVMTRTSRCSAKRAAMR